MYSYLVQVLSLLFHIYANSACVVPQDSNCTDAKDLGHVPIKDYSSAIYEQQNSLILGGVSSEPSIDDIPHEFKDIQKKHFSGNFNCSVPKHSTILRSQRRAIHHQLKYSLNQLALCPWKFVNNVDENRKPETMLEAVCACKFPDSQHPGVFCENVYQHVTVYRRSACEGGEYVYERVSERVAVACVTVALPAGKVAAAQAHRHMGPN